MKRIKNTICLFVSAVMLLSVLTMPAAAFAEDIAATQVVKYTGDKGDFQKGIAVTSDGSIYVITNSAYLIGFTKDGAENGFVAKLPSSYCFNLCAADGFVFAHTTTGAACVYVFEPAKSTAYKTLSAGNSSRFLTTANGYLYNLTGRENSAGKKVAVIQRAKLSAVKALADGDTIPWEKEYIPNYVTPSDDGNAYPQALAVDAENNAYLVDKGSNNGYDAAVSGIYRYNLNTGALTAMHFSNTAGDVLKLTWLYSVNVDAFGNVAVLSRNSDMIALFRPGSLYADCLIGTKGWTEDLASDDSGDLYYVSYGNVNWGNSVFRCSLNNVAVVGVGVPASKSVQRGYSFTLAASVIPTGATNQAVLYKSSDTKIATVSAAGVVKGVSVGTATITVQSAQGGKTATCTVTVLPTSINQPHAKATVSGIKNKTYTGNALTQSVTVKLGCATLKNGTDYTVSYKNNKAVGTATVTVTGKGNYTGTVSKTFLITPKGTALSKVTAGKKQFKVTWKKQTVQTTGYELQYSTNKDFKGAKTVIVPKNSTVSKTVKSLKAKKKYYVRVRTYKTVKKTKYYSSWSKAKTVTTKK